MGAMDLLTHLLSSDPGAPRLTVYNETDGSRMDFSAQTLDNWAAKVGNMLKEEFDLESGDTIAVALPVGWQAVTIVLGALAAEVNYRLLSPAELAVSEQSDIDVAFVGSDNFSAAAQAEIVDIAVVTEDPFGRGVEETGGTLPEGAVDFGPTVRFYGDQFPYPTAPLPALFPDAGASARLLSTGWSSREEFEARVLVPLAAGGSAVIVAGMTTADRLDEIAANEKVTARV